MRLRHLMLPTSLGACMALAPIAHSNELNSTQVLEEIQLMKEKIEQLEGQVAEQKSDKAESEGIKVHGAVRFQYSLNDYENDNKSRGGDLEFDTFRIGFDGEVGGIILSAEWRMYQYMNVIHHAWLGYNFNENSQLQAGINQVPFGVTPYNSNSFFFSSNAYLGLEDDYDFGFKYLYEKGAWDLNIAFYLNDEQGGIDGFVDNRSDRYSYDIVGARSAGEGTYDAPAAELAESNTLNTRLAYTFDMKPLDIEVGASLQYGELNDRSSKAGDNEAYAVHMVANYNSWNMQLQATRYSYDLDSGEETIAVGAFSFYDTIAASATTYTANIVYSMPVTWGPISNLKFYNDYSIVTNKSGGLNNTNMNVTGVAVTAGALYTYIDVIHAKNQPFVGGTMVGNGETEKRLNINFGYYF